jgi:hypothetical protein
MGDHVRNLYLFVAVVLVLSFQNCSPFESHLGQLPSSTSAVVAFSLNCSPADPREPQSSELKRLNSFELENTLIDLFEPYLSTSQRAEFINRIRPFIDDLPANRVHLGMSLADSGVTSIHVEKHFLLAEAVADFIASSQGVIGRMVAMCSTAANTESCRRQFLASFGLRALRRPLDTESIDFYLNVMNGYEDSYRNVIATLLASPLFYYHSEFGASDGNQSLVELDAYERASKLSYFLIQSMPDDALLSAAQSGEVLSQQGFQAHANRLLSTPKARQRLTRFFANQWLHLDETAEIRLDIQKVRALTSEIGTTNQIQNLRQNLINEVYDYFDYLIWEQGADYAQLMTSNLVFPRTPELAAIYGTSQWNGNYDITDLVRAPAEQRSGVLTLAQFLYTGSGSTRPIMRGVHVYRDFMCQNLDLPPDNSTPMGVVINHDMGDQEIVRATTEVPGTSCVGCHLNIINPLGFAFDNFDPIGRFREQELIFHPENSDEAGQVLLSKNVAPSQQINIPPFVQGSVDGAIGLSQQLAMSPDAVACFSSKIWNFAQKKNLRVTDNACAVQSVYESLSSSNASIIDAIRAVVMQPEFVKRNIQ